MTREPDGAGRTGAGVFGARRASVRWEFATAPGADGSFWDELSPVEGLPAFVAALSQDGTPGPEVRLRIRAVDDYRTPPDAEPLASGGPWASYHESGPVRRIHWRAREASGTAGLLVAAPGAGDEDGGAAQGRGAETVVTVSASNESFRRKLFRMSLISSLMPTGGVALVHGVVVTRGGFTVLLAGASGAGKSTLGLSAFAHGWRVVAEDLVFVTRDCSVVPLFLSGAWECRAHPADRALIAGITGAELRGHRAGLPADHRGREYHFPARPGEAPLPGVPLPVDLVLFVDREGDRPVTPDGWAGQVLDAGPRGTLGAVAKLLRIDFTPVVRETDGVLRRVVTEFPARRFSVTGRVADDVPRFLRSLDRWAAGGAA